MKLKTPALVMAAFFVIAGCFSIYSYQAITTGVSLETAGIELPVIILDAGHGGFDGGAVGADGIVEKDINLSIVQKLYDLFTINGFEVVMTRDEDESLHDKNLTTIRKQKNSDIHNRLALASAYPNSILISIHQNKFSQEKYWGAQVFYGPKDSESEVFGKIMQNRLVGMLQPENTRQYKKCGDNVYLIYNAPMPALLVECGFLSNPQEAHKLVTGEYQRQIAFAVFSATAEYLGLLRQAE
ncbi:MAG: N-acetylmuramoyl-L-alanine amidase [Anaerotruncus sp.]|nr:N-acetylmuramoyl-L-alanine amidase [Anaerotruncus sp.]